MQRHRQAAWYRRASVYRVSKKTWVQSKAKFGDAPPPPEDDEEED